LKLLAIPAEELFAFGLRVDLAGRNSSQQIVLSSGKDCRSMRSTSIKAMMPAMSPRRY
jgi:hypothetical protein